MCWARARRCHQTVPLADVGDGSGAWSALRAGPTGGVCRPEVAKKQMEV